MILAPDGYRIRREVEPPPDALRELEAFHPLLGMRWLTFHRTWAIVWYWGKDPNDPRMQHVQGQRQPPEDAHAIVCEVPQDCSAHEAVNYAKRHLILNPPSDMWKSVAQNVAAHNLRVEEEVTKAAMADVMNRIEVSAGMTKFHFAEGAEDTDLRALSFEVDAPSLEEIRAAQNDGVFD